MQLLLAFLHQLGGIVHVGYLGEEFSSLCVGARFIFCHGLGVGQTILALLAQGFRLRQVRDALQQGQGLRVGARFALRLGLSKGQLILTLLAQGLRLGQVGDALQQG